MADLFEAGDLAVQLEMAINEMRMGAGEELAPFRPSAKKWISINVLHAKHTGEIFHQKHLRIFTEQLCVYIPFVNSFFTAAKGASEGPQDIGAKFQVSCADSVEW